MMFVQRLRRRLFGYKKEDVFAFIAEVDKNAAEKLEEKDKEIEVFKNRILELEAERDAVATALMAAEAKSKDIVEAAQAKADAIIAEAEEEIRAQKEAHDAEMKAERDAIEKEISEKRAELDHEIQTEKTNVNREIEVKRKAIKNYYTAENKKIDQIKSEVERMRRASIEAIRNFENQLQEVERLSENSGSYIDSALSFSQTEAAIEPFGEIERNIPVHIIESISE